MFVYYLALAFRSLKRNPALTALMIVTIGFGVAASMTTWSVFRAVSGDLIPQKSSELFVPQIDNWGPSGRASGSKSNEPPNALDYTDAVALMRAHRARYQSAMYEVIGTILPQRVSQEPTLAMGEAVYGEFFPMLDVPFEYGSGWSAVDDTNRAQVIVISGRLNDQLFAGRDSVGKTLMLAKHTYRVVGVLNRWHPQPVFYDLNNSPAFSGLTGSFFIPFTTSIALKVPDNSSENCTAPPGPGMEGLMRSECVWISFMVQLDDAAAVQRYHLFLVNYAAQQQQVGRFHWPPNVRLRGLMAWLDHMHVVPPDTRISLYIALGLLLVCLVNVAGLLLAKFMRRSGEIGVRRALGASRRQIYARS